MERIFIYHDVFAYQFYLYCQYTREVTTTEVELEYDLWATHLCRLRTHFTPRSVPSHLESLVSCDESLEYRTLSLSENEERICRRWYPRGDGHLVDHGCRELPKRPIISISLPGVPCFLVCIPSTSGVSPKISCPWPKLSRCH